MEDLPIFPSFERKMEVMGLPGSSKLPLSSLLLLGAQTSAFEFSFVFLGGGETRENDQIFSYSLEATMIFGFFHLAVGKGDLNNPVDLGF